MLFADIDILDENFVVCPHRWVGVRDGRIAYVGDKAPTSDEAASFGEVYDGAGKLLMPAVSYTHLTLPTICSV